MTSARLAAALTLIMLLALCLRLYHVRDPILDHPAWRQGDESAIARNFLELRNNIFYPQVDYDGPPPNYVQLELQIVPYTAAQLYRVFGVHEVLERLLVIAFSLATIPLVYLLGSELYSRRAGIIAALLFAIAPGAVYYGRAIIPESDMLFFSVGALLFWWRWMRARSYPDFVLAILFGIFAWLAKPPAVLALAPMIAVAFARRGVRAFADWSLYAMIVLTLAPLFVYLGHLDRIAEWHWTSGITSKHVLPQLVHVLTSPHALLATVQSTLALLRMLASTVVGPVLFGLLLLAALTQPRADAPSTEHANRADAGARAAFFATWFVTLCVYAFVVVTVERVDYYLMPFIPFVVLYVAGALDNILNLLWPQGISDWASQLAVLAAVFITTYANMLEIHPYYTWSRPVYAAATEVRAVLEPQTLIVMGHYDPSVLYTIGHRGWEEDALLWNTHDMTSAIAKSARYFVAVEVPRFRANKPLYAFMQRYRRVPVHSGWQVFDMHHFARSPMVRGSEANSALHSEWAPSASHR